MMDRALVPVSKFLSKVLRHAPESVGLRLDEAGWAEVGDLLDAAERAGVPIDRATLERVVAENDKRRFAFSEDGRRIRASQGHSVDVDLGLEAKEPPEVLFHGTAAASLDAIRREGLRPGRRTHVHLSVDEATAVAVGSRHGAPVVLRVAAGRLHREGRRFYRSDNGVWLTDTVPPDALDGPHPGSGPHPVS
jgi:putative RNA 2'-phosphotransferase